MKQTLTNPVIFSICIFLVTLFLTSCKKNDARVAEKAIAQTASSSLINAARDYFNKDIFPAQSVKNANSQDMSYFKEPVWSNAYVSKRKSGDAVVVPLKYDKQVYLTTSGNDTKMSLQSQTRLYMYKDAKGAYHTECVTFLPDKKEDSILFSGIIKVEDWNGNPLHTYLYKNGKTFRFKNTGSSQVLSRDLTTAKMVCYYINWYDCQTDLAGNNYDCQYLSSTFLGCADDMEEEEEIDYIDNGDGSSSIDEYVALTLPALTTSTEYESIGTVYDESNKERDRNYKWVFLEGPSLKFYSWDKTHQIKGNDGQWRMQSYSHIDDAMVGTIAGWNVSHTLKGLTSTLGEFSVLIVFDANVKFDAKARNYPITQIQSFPIKKAFLIDDGN